MKLGDIYYILFRHKWKIIVLSMLGFMAAGVILLVKKPLYGSEAEMLVKYVVNSRPKALVGDIQNTDPRGDNILNSEVRILTSYDLASNVVSALGPEMTKRILGKDAVGDGDDSIRAAKLIRRNIDVEPIKHTDVLKISFEHADREVVQPVLMQLISNYLELHAEIHNKLGISDVVLNRQLINLSNQLYETEEALRDAKAKTGAVSPENAKASLASQIDEKRREISSAEADLAQQQAALKEYNSMTRPVLVSSSPSNAPAIPPERLTEYKSVMNRLDAAIKKRDELRTWAMETSTPVRDVQEQITSLEQQKNQLEDKYPGLVSIPVVIPTVSGPSTSPNAFDPANAAVQIEALKSKIGKMNEQLEQLKREVARVEEMDATISELQRRKEVQETEYRSYESSLSQARFNEALEQGKLSNITPYELPTPPFKDTEKINKLAGIAAGGGLGASLILAFLLELFLDQTVKRPQEIESRLRLPLFLSIPDTHQNGRSFPGLKSKKQLLLDWPTDGAADGNGNGAVAAWDSNHKLRLFFEALRDRLFVYFETRNLKHNPKLVAVTACNEGAGVTTVASGLAATLSETGEGNVLLIDMNNGEGAARPFFKGKPACTLAEALEGKDNAMVQERLYVVAEGSPAEEQTKGLPNEFTQLVPKLKASDYDYIIFDLPPVSQISVTSKMARMMDVNLLVIESEKTDRDIVKQASSMIGGAKANVGVVLNKKRTYVPSWLLQEL